jgi:excisionase family DNA binding protein
MRKKAALLNQYLKSKDMATLIEGIKFYTIPETAAALRVTPQTIRAWIKQGKIKSQRIGRPILITENNLKEFLQATVNSK